MPQKRLLYIAGWVALLRKVFEPHKLGEHRCFNKKVNIQINDLRGKEVEFSDYLPKEQPK